jgi:hypothetical protein
MAETEKSRTGERTRRSGQPNSEAPAKTARQKSATSRRLARPKAPPDVLAPVGEIVAAVAPAVDNPFVISPEERHRLIAEAAYFRAERRGFDGGEEQALQDWLEAEAELDRTLAGVEPEQGSERIPKKARD